MDLYILVCECWCNMCTLVYTYVCMYLCEHVCGMRHFFASIKVSALGLPLQKEVYLNLCCEVFNSFL